MKIIKTAWKTIWAAYSERTIQNAVVKNSHKIAEQIVDEILTAIQSGELKKENFNVDNYLGRFHELWQGHIAREKYLPIIDNLEERLLRHWQDGVKAGIVQRIEKSLGALT
jgi:hypothetical protein